MEYDRFIAVINEFEEYFNNTLTDESFKFEDGEGPVIISAPHSVEQTRDGRIKFAEPQTGVLARILHQEFHCPVIYKTYNDGDANFDAISEYKNALVSYINQNTNIKVLIDLHQLSPLRDVMIDIGTGSGKNIFQNTNLVSIIQSSFDENLIRPIEIDVPFDASYEYTISSYIAKNCTIPAIQIEMNSSLFMQEIDPTRNSFFRVFLALSDIVLKLWGIYGYKN